MAIHGTTGNLCNWCGQRVDAEKINAELFDTLNAVWDFWAGGDVPPELAKRIESALAKAKL